MIKGDIKKLGLYLSGQPIFFEPANIVITQPTVNNVVLFGEDEFLMGVSLLSNTDNLVNMVKEGNSELEVFSDFQLLMIILEEDSVVSALLQELFTLLFPDYIFEITSGGINFFLEEGEEKVYIGQIHPYNFNDFQNLLADLFIPQKTEEEEKLDYKPANAAAEKIAEKLKRGRAKIQQANPAGSLFANFTSTLSIGLGLDIRILYQYTPFQLYDAYRRFFDKQTYDLHMRIKTMPLMSTEGMDDPKEWTRNLYS